MACCLRPLSHYMNQLWLIDTFHWNKSSVTKVQRFFYQRECILNVVCKVVAIFFRPQWVNTLRPRQNGHHFADDTFIRIFLYENVRILIKISLKFVPKGPINNIPALVQVMAWRRSGDKPLSEPMMVSLLTHICVTRPQWVNANGGQPPYVMLKHIHLQLYWYHEIALKKSINTLKPLT